MEFEELTEFKEDLKSLLKKYRTLNDDLKEVKTILSKKPDKRPPFSFCIDNYGLCLYFVTIRQIG